MGVLGVERPGLGGGGGPHLLSLLSCTLGYLHAERVFRRQSVSVDEGYSIMRLLKGGGERLGEVES